MSIRKYRTILADPPWDINQKGKYGAGKHYELMKLDRIKAMPVADFSEWIYQCAESACPVFWKSPVRKEEIMVSDR